MKKKCFLAQMQWSALNLIISNLFFAFKFSFSQSNLQHALGAQCFISHMHIFSAMISTNFFLKGSWIGSADT